MNISKSAIVINIYLISSYNLPYFCKAAAQFGLWQAHLILQESAFKGSYN